MSQWMSPDERQPTQVALIRQSLQEQIRAGLLRPGMRLPSERALSERFATTRITLKEALAVLETEGQIYREERRGWFVAPPRLIYDPRTKSHFQAMVESQGRVATTRVLQAGPVVANAELCQRMGLAPLSPLLKICRVRSLDSRDVLYVEHYLLPERFPSLLETDLTCSLTRLYAERYGIGYGQSTFDILPTAAHGPVARALGLPQGAPLLQICRLNLDERGRLIDCDMEYWRQDAVVIRIQSDPLPPDSALS